MRKTGLTNEEKRIENEMQNLKSISDKKREQIDGIIARANKNKSISLRISSYDLDKIKEKANESGISYQTYINMILHKYITNQFYEKDNILRSIQLLKET